MPTLPKMPSAPTMPKIQWWQRLALWWYGITPPKVPTFDEVLEALNGHLFFAIISSAFGAAFQHGYNTGVVNMPQSVLENFIKDRYYERNGAFPTEKQVKIIWSTVVSLFIVGGMVGAMFSVLVANHLGRKVGLLSNNIFVFIAAALQGFAKMANSYNMLIAGRFVIGINCGINAALTPMYLTEISPIALRGAVGTVYQLIITITILLSQIFGLPQIFGTKDRWPILFGLIIVPSILMIATFTFCPESPRHLLKNGKDDKAKQALEWLMQTESIDDELNLLKAEVESEKAVKKVTVGQLLTEKKLRKPLTIAVVMMLAQQFSGINAVIYYSTSVFQDSGLSEEGALYATISMGVVNVVMTIVSMVLVDYCGRKTLLLIGMSGMAILTFLITLTLGLQQNVNGMQYVTIACILLFMVTFASGLGSIPWFLVSELFSQSARPIATSIAVAVNWIANFAVGMGFLPLAILMKHYVFLIFTVLLVLFALFTYFVVPETKGKTIEEITAKFE